MTSLRKVALSSLFLCFLSLSPVDGLACQANAGEARTLVFINGVATQVHFSDGDTFNQREGKYQGNSRLAGFNTLESFGPVHQWGDWHPFELWVNAKQATYNARKGIWHCTTMVDEEKTKELQTDDSQSTYTGIGDDAARDGYGRWLIDCPDLAIDQIRKGFAHAMTIDDEPQRPEYLRAQREAMAAKRGMWKKGIPPFIITSLHSADESSKPIHKNRTVSTRDGHSEKWEHSQVYPECSWQCGEKDIVADPQLVNDFARSLRENPKTKHGVAELSNILLTEIVERYVRLKTFPDWLSEEATSVLEPLLLDAIGQGAFGEMRTVRTGCALYVAFQRRYGDDRAWCLRKHGTKPPPTPAGQEIDGEIPDEVTVTNDEPVDVRMETK